MFPIAAVVCAGRSSDLKSTTRGEERHDQGAEMYLGHAHENLPSACTCLAGSL
jgi:hypothetical protein